MTKWNYLIPVATIPVVENPEKLAPLCSPVTVTSEGGGKSGGAYCVCWACWKGWDWVWIWVQGVPCICCPANSGGLKGGGPWGNENELDWAKPIGLWEICEILVAEQEYNGGVQRNSMGVPQLPVNK